MPDRQTALLLTMREILEAEVHSSPGNLEHTGLLLCYLSCMDTGPTETAGPEAFLRLVHKAEELIQNVYSSKSKLPDLRWRDEESRMSVLNKVTIDEHKYFSIDIQSLSLQRQRSSELFSQTEGDDSWSITPFLSINELVFPMGMFVQPLFHPTYPSPFSECVSQVHSRVCVVPVPEYERGVVLAVTSTAAGDVGAVLCSADCTTGLQSEFEEVSWGLLSNIHLFLTSFTQINCDSDLYHEFMPFEPSFLVTVICGYSDLCLMTLSFPNKPQQHLLGTC
ncbi:uncharacterized protein LOC115188085 [Salmo trutta]|uniref:uncharacterized protein LOC115188085 n=1 Tax=Salmo trutta TaxID=8032 RepID=UPI0011314EF7|nr:uncharacterized protein LOC115188085 [Salmo trutta]